MFGERVTSLVTALRRPRALPSLLLPFPLHACICKVVVVQRPRLVALANGQVDLLDLLRIPFVQSPMSRTILGDHIYTIPSYDPSSPGLVLVSCRHSTYYSKKHNINNSARQVREQHSAGTRIVAANVCTKICYSSNSNQNSKVRQAHLRFYFVPYSSTNLYFCGRF